MSPRPVRTIRTNIVKKGFVEVTNRDHIYFWLVVDGKDTGIKTKVSHGEVECNDRLLGFMARQVHLSRKDFDNLIDCKLGKESYLNLLRESGDISA